MKQDLRNAIAHLRFGFSFFLMPVYLWAIAQSPAVDWAKAGVAFCILHLLIYPSSNGFNSYHDQDTGSIGGLKNPPKAPVVLVYITFLMDVAGLALSFWLLGRQATALLLAYILASRAYSHRRVRLKRYPIVGYLVVFIFQGAVVYAFTAFAVRTNLAYEGFSFWQQEILPLCIASLMMGGSYPITQIYQHEQDKADGVQTLSILLGVRGTFLFVGVILLLLNGALLFLFFQQARLAYFGAFLVCTAPIGLFFGRWVGKTWHNFENANFENTMRMNLLGSVGINVFLLGIILWEKCIF
jgi:1,4-dihydroxy-2-naphthoate octaprenyltransferase